jgi:hypothetical protein
MIKAAGLGVRVETPQYEILTSFGLAALAFAGYSIAIFFTREDHLVNFFHDDSFFYMVIARNLAAGLGYTFDGIDKTNGFHPLWLWALTALASAIELKGEIGLRATALFFGFWSISGAFLYLKILHKNGVKRGVQCLFLLIYVLTCAFADTGQESALLGFVFALIVTLAFADSERHRTSKKFLLFALLALVVVFARQDSIFILGGLALALLLQKRYADFFSVFLGTFSGLVSLAIFNVVNFGHIYSISSWLKVNFDVNNLREISVLGLSIRVAFVLTLLLVASANARRSSSNLWLLRLTLCTLLVCLVYFATLFLFVQAPGSWYLNQPIGFALFLFFLSLRHPGKDWKRRVINGILIVSLLSMSSYLVVRKMFFDSYTLSALSMARWINANTRSTDIVFLVDGSGRVSYFSDRSIINGDGLVNSMEFQTEVRAGRVCEYLKSKKVAYVATKAEKKNASDLVSDSIPLWRNDGDVTFLQARTDSAIFVTTLDPAYRIFPVSASILMCAHERPKASSH